jgi:hypothetical protein
MSNAVQFIRSGNGLLLNDGNSEVHLDAGSQDVCVSKRKGKAKSAGGQNRTGYARLFRAALYR